MLEGEGEGEWEIEGESEWEAEAEAEVMRQGVTLTQAQAELMAAQAANAQNEAEAEAMIGAASVAVLTPADRAALRRVLPHIIRGAAILTRILRRRRVTRPVVRVVPTVVARTARTLAAQQAATGGPSRGSRRRVACPARRGACWRGRARRRARCSATRRRLASPGSRRGRHAPPRSCAVPSRGGRRSGPCRRWCAAPPRRARERLFRAVP